MKPIGYQVPGYDYFWAGNGVFVEAKNRHLLARIPLAEFKTRGLEDVKPEIVLQHGLIPIAHLDFILDTLGAKNEQYYAIVWEDGKYWIKRPAQLATPGSVKYEILPNVVMEIHTHPPNCPEFSGQDDADELGFKIYGVVSPEKASDRYQVVTSSTILLRVGVYGYFYELDLAQVFTGKSSFHIENPAMPSIESVNAEIADDMRDYWRHLNSGAER